MDALSLRATTRHSTLGAQMDVRILFTDLSLHLLGATQTRLILIVVLA